jgi:hypothetical protein
MSDSNITQCHPDVNLEEVKVVFMEDGSAYLDCKVTKTRICKAYGFDSAQKDTWRSRTSFLRKEGEEGFWAMYDDRKVVKELD